MKFRFVWLLDLLSVAAAAALGGGCSGCLGVPGPSVWVVVLDAVTLDPVCAVVTPGLDACPFLRIGTEAEGRMVQISAPGYRPLSYKVVPKFGGERAPGGGCNVVLLERQ
jgi:hypothetical protein